MKMCELIENTHAVDDETFRLAEALFQTGPVIYQGMTYSAVLEDEYHHVIVRTKVEPGRPFAVDVQVPEGIATVVLS